MRIAREGYPLILTAGIAALIALAIGWGLLGSLLALLTLAVAAFFRDPERVVPAALRPVNPQPRRESWTVSVDAAL